LELYKKLQDIWEELSKVLGKLTETVKEIKEKEVLLCKQFGFAYGRQPLPQTNLVSIQTYVDLCEEILLMYQSELNLKKEIVGDIYTNSNRDTLMLYLSSWQMEPFLKQETIHQFESMVGVQKDE